MTTIAFFVEHTVQELQESLRRSRVAGKSFSLSAVERRMLVSIGLKAEEPVAKAKARRPSSRASARADSIVGSDHSDRDDPEPDDFWEGPVSDSADGRGGGDG